ncbi:MAG: NADPH-dependent FMN reductase [Bdellovibrionia bacterium]
MRLAKENVDDAGFYAWFLILVRGIMMSSMRIIRILALSGSLRNKSYNSAVLRAAKTLAPRDVEISLFERLGEIPLFNPDLGDGENFSAVSELRKQIAQCDAFLVSSPEYVHGVPGALKNALDWIVGTGELDGKSVGIINATPAIEGAQWAQQGLIEILNVMSANRVVNGAVLKLDAIRKKVDESGEIIDPSTRESIIQCIEALANAARQT